MIKTDSQYKAAMRRMIRRVQSGELANAPHLDMEQSEVLADCIREGYINGTVMRWSKNREQDTELRTLDGMIHPKIFNNVIPLKGLVFLANRPDWKFLIPTILSLIATITAIAGVILPIYLGYK